MRVDIARALCLAEPLIVFDEFTSVVDREIAKVSAFAISKAVRRSRKKFMQLPATMMWLIGLIQIGYLVLILWSLVEKKKAAAR